MDYSDLLSSVVNERDSVFDSAENIKQTAASHLEGASGLLEAVGGGIGGVGLATAKAFGLTAESVAEKSGVLVTQIGKSVANAATDAVNSVVSPLVSSALSGAPGVSANVFAGASEGAGAFVGDEAVGSLLGPVGFIGGLFAFLGTEIAGAVDGFEAHHETDSINMDDLTSIAFDPSHT